MDTFSEPSTLNNPVGLFLPVPPKDGSAKFLPYSSSPERIPFAAGLNDYLRDTPRTIPTSPSYTFSGTEMRLFFQTGSRYVSLAGLNFTLYTKLLLNPQRPACLCLPRVGHT